MTTRAVPRRRAAGVALAAAVSLAVAAGCVADPPPPTVVGEEGPDGAPVSVSESGLLLALDRVDEGFNPHLLADQGVDTDLVASLLLPSTFVPGPDGEPQLNRALLVSAEPLEGAPATIRYTIHPRAQWSDGVPVAAEDFEYLWRQMTTQPGVVDPAGYEQITSIRAGAGGKVVDVVFDSPPQHWQHLFSHLLPGHILKDAPSGFQAAMESLPVMSAGPYMIRTADIGRGEIEFVPNDRYWAQTPELAQIVVRRAVDAGQLGGALRDGPGVVALAPASPVASDVAATVPGISSVPVESSAQLELAFNTAGPLGGDRAVRRAVAAAVEPEVIGRIVTGETGPAVSSFPFPPGTGHAPTADPATVRRTLSDAGFAREGARWEREGVPLSVTLGVDPTDDRALTAAFTVADQLRTAGIGARVWELGPVALYADALPHGLVDAVVGWQRVDGQADLAAVSRYGCATGPDQGATSPSPPTRPRTTVTSLVPPEPDVGTTPATTPSGTTTTVPTTPSRTVGRDAPARAGDIAGVCDPQISRTLGLDGDRTAPDLAAAGEVIAREALRVPLVRPGYLLSDDGVHTGDPPPGAPDEGIRAGQTVADIFDTVPTWRRTG